MNASLTENQRPQAEPALFSAHLWPHQSLGKRGQNRAIFLFALLLITPLAVMLLFRGAFILLPFLYLPVPVLAFAFARNRYAHQIHEYLTITQNQLDLIRIDPDGTKHEFHAQPYWVRAELRRDGPVPDYLTLSNQNRIVELGSFLTQDERRALYIEVQNALNQARAAKTSP